MSTTLGEARSLCLTKLAFGALGVLAFLGAVSCALVAGYRRPALNFDLVDYVALALEWVEDDPEAVHRRTYEVLAAELPPDVFVDFTSGGSPTAAGPYRERIAKDWEAFDANLGFHRGRYLYTATVCGLNALGVPLVAATAVPNLIFWGLTALFVLFWATRHFALGPAAVFALGILYSPPVLSLVPASTPDGMATFLVVLSLYLVLEQRAFLASATLLTLAILVRSDFVLISGGVAAALFLLVERSRRPSNGSLLAWLAICLVLYLAVSRSARDPGWWAAFSCAWIRVGDFDEVIPFEPRLYLLGMKERLAGLSYHGYDGASDGSFVRGSNFVLTYCAAAAGGIALALRSRLKAFDVHVAVLAGLLVATAVRYVVFPHLWDRYFVYLWVPVPLCLAGMAAELIARLNGAERAERTGDAAPAER
ncbi:MAG: hypothetical protein HOP15_17710 [Planctomycetes bacterium]|nr:hypothetical protein [Planctomycetota bacterium]